jgi:hypothetical protein
MGNLQDTARNVLIFQAWRRAALFAGGVDVELGPLAADVSPCPMGPNISRAELHLTRSDVAIVL